MWLRLKSQIFSWKECCVLCVHRMHLVMRNLIGLIVYSVLEA